jgi:hypothetical protein
MSIDPNKSKDKLLNYPQTYHIFYLNNINKLVCKYIDTHIIHTLCDWINNDEKFYNYHKKMSKLLKENGDTYRLDGRTFSNDIPIDKMIIIQIQYNHNGKWVSGKSITIGNYISYDDELYVCNYPTHKMGRLYCHFDWVYKDNIWLTYMSDYIDESLEADSMCIFHDNHRRTVFVLIDIEEFHKLFA